MLMTDSVTEKKMKDAELFSEKILYNRSFEELVKLRVKNAERSLVCTLIIVIF